MEGKKTFRDLLKDVENSLSNLHTHEVDRKVKLYYITDQNNKTGTLKRLNFVEFIRSLEKCRNICDIKLTHKIRSNNINEAFCLIPPSTPSSETQTDFNGISPQASVKMVTRKDSTQEAKLPDELLFATPAIKEHDRIYFSASEFCITRSENAMWDALQISQMVQKDYHRFSGFVIVDRFEEMDYLSTGVSMLATTLNKPIIFTGGIEDLYAPVSDMNANILTSLMISYHYHIPEVCIQQDGFLYRACRTAKSKCEHTYNFYSPNFPPLAQTMNFDININWNLIRRSFYSGKDDLVLDENFTDKVSNVFILPNMNDVHLEIEFSSNDGLILEAFGKGNIPSNTILKHLITSKNDNNAKVFIVSQCHKGDVGGNYSSSGEHIGAFMCGDMTSAASFAKVSMILVKSKDKSEISGMLRRSWRGEITEDESLNYSKDGGIIRYLESKITHYVQDKTELRLIIDSLLPSIMQSAAKYNNPIIFEEILTFNSSFKTSKTYDGLNLIHSTIFHFNRSFLAMIIKHFKDEPEEIERMIYEKDSFGYTPMDYCIQTKVYHGIKALSLKKITSDHLHTSSLGSIINASIDNNVEVIRNLLEAKVLLTTIKDQFGRTPVHIAFSLNHIEQIKLYLDANVDFEVVDDDGLTPRDHCLNEEVKSQFDEFLAAKSRKQSLETERKLELTDDGAIDISCDLGSGESDSRRNFELKTRKTTEENI